MQGRSFRLKLITWTWKCPMLHTATAIETTSIPAHQYQSILADRPCPSPSLTCSTIKMTTSQPIPPSAFATPLSTPYTTFPPPPTSSPANASPPTANASSSATSYAKAKIEQFNEMIRKTQQSAWDMHDNVHASCHDRVAARLAAARIQPPTADEALRYRYHHGVNLGSCFVLEKWLTPSSTVSPQLR